MNQRNISIVLGVILLLVLFIVAIYYFGSSTTKNVEPKSKVETVEKIRNTQWKKKVEKTLKNHEKRITGLEERQERDSDAITDLQSQIDSLKNQKGKNSDTTVEGNPKKGKYEKGWNSKKNWDYKDSWE